ncbi:MAG: hypothetical protein EOO01_21555 [Chitinophagaceae bacterium]|nr:MAG: hypothetical protein EOO01_21555 [Chitinophagaceae bacterium]
MKVVCLIALFTIACNDSHNGKEERPKDTIEFNANSYPQGVKTYQGWAYVTNDSLDTAVRLFDSVIMLKAESFIGSEEKFGEKK